jgi:hypothetical protein
MSKFTDSTQAGCLCRWSLVEDDVTDINQRCPLHGAKPAVDASTIAADCRARARAMAWQPKFNGYNVGVPVISLGTAELLLEAAVYAAYNAGKEAR